MVVLASFVLLLVDSLVSRRLESTVVTAPILFTVAGIVLVLAVPSAGHLGADRSTLLLVAELGLVLTLFTDSSRINLRALEGNRGLPGQGRQGRTCGLRGEPWLSGWTFSDVREGAGRGAGYSEVAA